MSAPEVRYERIRYVALNVSNLERARAFYTNVVGLELLPNGISGSAMFRCNHSHHDLLLTEAAVPGLKRVSWRLETAADLHRLQEHLAGIGMQIVPVAAEEAGWLGFDAGFRIAEPTTGAIFEFSAGVSGAADFASGHTKILRLGHMVLRSLRPRDTIAFLLDHLNFRVSDHVEGAVTFMRCFPNPLHHSFGVSHAESPGLHHVNFMVSDIDDVGRALHRFRKENVPVVYGPGRHPTSDSVFLYFLDPDGLTLEYSYGMEEFPEIAPRTARMFPLALESFDHWGAVPAPGMASTGEIEQLDLQGA